MAFLSSQRKRGDGLISPSSRILPCPCKMQWKRTCCWNRTSALFEWSHLLLSSRVRLPAPPWAAARHTSLSFTISWGLLKPMSIEPVMPSNHLILDHPLLLLPSVFPSIRVFSNESALRIRWPKYWSFSFSISPSSEYWGLISLRMDWLDLLAVPRNSQVSSLTPQFKSINSLFGLLYGPTLTSIMTTGKDGKK